MMLWDGLAVIGAMVSIAFCGWCISVASQNIRQFEEVEPKELPEVNDLPKWEKLNPVGKMANKELKKMYRGKMRGELS